ncbi:DNA polymerase III subunit delta [Pelagibacterium halotolerans]|uniref:DNA-directed DNA polymerase n=1 Tax=Pelagibacterium halotolerans (strain DSM 22347 / JCM 15775 / CGMCC 1.7692 / B2) TaxID=1082931 RepID=G4R7Q0_PELHB|nr:DNA polymerase III subunit delta [Pelagibacterium halotolerans]AEQ53310.1 DNA polymerase III delta subunit [Pelagibacterium halotolerans B2]QJR17075.1 DNA polymerase III subunit delta [Pelagibacterium halotolerans]SEA63275.1 DNA polymerase III, delta subunit [Pelagibacterium halotolerans]
MTALKGRDIEKFLSRPDLAAGLVLVYGPDIGLVSENAAQLVKHFAGDPPDPESLSQLHMSEIDADPQHLGILARSPSLFGSQATIRIRAATNKLAPTLVELLDEGAQAVFIVEGADLKPSDALRKHAEARKDARALPCYADTGQTIDGLIRETFAKANISLETDLAPMLRDMLGNDRQVTRSELQKLVLYAGEGGKLTRDDVMRLCGDNAALAIDAVVDAIATGHARRFDDAMTRAAGAGTDAQRLLIVAMQHFSRLRAMRAEIDAGAGIDQVLGRATPRIHFSRKASFEQQLRLWNDDGLAAACNRLASAILESRKSSALAPATGRQALLAICMAAARR